MKTNEVVRQKILDAVDNQINSNNPPETKQTFKRLIELGCTEEDAKIYIAQCVAVEIFEVLKNKKPFDLKRYVKNLNKLPEEPFDD